MDKQIEFRNFLYTKIKGLCSIVIGLQISKGHNALHHRGGAHQDGLFQDQYGPPGRQHPRGLLQELVHIH